MTKSEEWISIEQKYYAQTVRRQPRSRVQSF